MSNTNIDWDSITIFGILSPDNIIYGYSNIGNYLIFSTFPDNNFNKISVTESINHMSCKLIENENFVCAVTKDNDKNKLYINYLKYYTDLANNFGVNLNSNENNYYQNSYMIESFYLYNTEDNYIKLLCFQNSQNVECKFFQAIITTQSNLILGEDIILFEGVNDFNEKTCDLTQFNFEYLFCCTYIDYIKCFRINNVNYNIIKEFKISINGLNSYLSIESNDNYVSFFYMNTLNNKNSVYEYNIYIPECKNINYSLLNSLNENKSEEDYEKLSNLFTVKTNKYYFELKNQPNEFGYFTLNGEIINQRTLISNNTDYILDFNVTNKNIIGNPTETVFYFISVEDEKAYSKECEISLSFQSCYYSCETCSLSSLSSGVEHHNCINCKNNYYKSPMNDGNCYLIEEKLINWYFDIVNQEFGFCNVKCLSCIGPTEYNCSACNNGSYLDNNSCKENCSEGYFPTKIEIDFNHYYFKCIKCYQNCKTCFNSGDSQNMMCETCKENQIKYNNSCFNINDHSIKNFDIPENSDGLTIATSCKESFGLYIKEDLNECIPLPDENEGYYISNTQTGLLSKCHDNCLSCSNGPIKEDSGNIQSMECIKCKDENSSEKTMIKYQNNCFNIIQYSETKIMFEISGVELNVVCNCKYFGKAIYYGKYECIDKPDNTYYVLNDEDDNTGVIKNCNEACQTCLGEGNTLNTNCLVCAPGYYKSEESSNQCLKEDSIQSNYLNTIDNTYYNCFHNCKDCFDSYNPITNEMHCLQCIKDYYFIFEENNCYNFTLLQENKYYFNYNESKFHKCYHSCSECLNVEPSETNHSCLKCISGYYFLENTNNCFDKNLTEEGYYLNILIHLAIQTPLLPDFEIF